jgi:spore coat polysaccharide biosynthesis protein SpsF
MTDNPGQFKIAAVAASDDASNFRVTIDTREDLAVVRAVVNALGDGPFSAHALITWLRSNPSIAELNSHVSQKRDDEG